MKSLKTFLRWESEGCRKEIKHFEGLVMQDLI